MKRRIVLLGPPASGKGSQAAMLSRHYRIPAASTGAMLREEHAAGTELGALADSSTRRGRYFSDEVAMQVAQRWLEHRWQAFILDGFPRTIGQTRAFDAELDRRHTRLDVVFHLDLPPAECRRRVLDRLACPSCRAVFSGSREGFAPGGPCPACGVALSRRPDDSPETVDERIAQHRTHTVPVVDHYRHRGLVIDIDASPDEGSIFDAICRHLGNPVPA